MWIRCSIGQGLVKNNMVAGWDYRRSGVDREKADRILSRVARTVRSTRRPEVIADIGGFAGIFRLPSSAGSTCLVAGTDGVGTKLKIAQALGRHETVGQDLVAMCVNDIVCTGAEPLFFLDYFACGRLEPLIFENVIEGIAEGCREAGCALLGGETAEMPEMYGEDEYDLAGFAVGAVQEDRIIDGKKIRQGDVLIGLPSSGLHSNGYSLVRAVLRDRGISFDREIDGHPLEKELLRPTRIYTRILPRLQQLETPVRGIVHITGGGLPGNLVRVLPAFCRARIHTEAVSVPWIFGFLQREGHVSDKEMWRTFNMGVGLVLIFSPENIENAVSVLKDAGESPFLLGEIEEGDKEVLLHG